MDSFVRFTSDMITTNTAATEVSEVCTQCSSQIEKKQMAPQFAYH